MAKREKKVSNQKNRFLTINFNNEFIKVSEVSKTSKNLMVHKVFSMPTPARAYRDGVIRDRNAIAKELTIALQKNGILTTNVIFTVSSSKIATKEVIIPFVNKKKMASIIKMNATEYFPVNIDEYIIESSIIEVIENPDNKKDKKLKLLVTAAPDKMIEEYYDFASTMGLKIIAIDYLGNSTLQLLKLQSDVDTSIMIQIENDSTIISVFDKNVLQLQRTVPYGKSMIVNAVMEKRRIFNYDVALDILQKEQLIHTDFDGDEITESLRFLVGNVSRIMDYQVSRNSNKPIEKAYIVGNATYIIGLEELFANSLNAPVESISFLKGVEADKHTYVEETTLTAYIANIGAVISPINFTPKSLSTPAAKSSSGGNEMKIVLVGAIVAAAFLIIIPYVQMVMARNDMDEAKERLDAIASIEEVMAEYRTAQSEYEDVNSFRVMTVNNNDVLIEFLINLESYLPSSVRVDEIEIVDGNVSISGYAENKYSVAKAVMQLKAIDNVYDVFDYKISEEVDGNGIVTLEYTMALSFVNPSLFPEDVAAITEGE